ncbi:hypothetical protein H109_04561 [Trichophyton interdigitale MR816]|uniref:Uncharacterized protein n=1 Tax=Trichophyton interdigitale (strain MR816) TaxID=1215338 RepID=A0A059J786_TRIIM|nr:hypothetical protein H109_04561 [Trichophyton interdigitale MR816]
MDSIKKSGDRPLMRLLRSNAPPSPPQVLSAQKLFTTIRNEILQARGYKKPTRRGFIVIRGIVKVYGRNGVGGPQLLQTETIFPAPPNPEAQTIPITRGQLMGPNLLAGRNPGDVHRLSVDLFRRAAGKLVRREGYTPA